MKAENWRTETEIGMRVDWEALGDRLGDLFEVHRFVFSSYLSNEDAFSSNASDVIMFFQITIYESKKVLYNVKKKDQLLISVHEN
jgi:hypothetical protein